MTHDTDDLVAAALGRLACDECVEYEDHSHSRMDDWRTVRDALRRSSAEAATTCWQHRPGAPCPVPASCRDNGCSAVEREVLEAEVAALRADAARYRHMRENATFRSSHVPCGPYLRWLIPQFMRGDTPEKLDAAIDAARKG